MVGETLNIDDLPASGIVDRIERTTSYMMLGPKYARQARAERMHRINSGKRSWIGFAPEKLLDWRQLESRQHQLRLRYEQGSTDFWGTLKRFYEIAKEQGADAVWAVPEDRTGDGTSDVLVFDGKSYGWSDSKRLIKEHVPRPDKRALVLNASDSSAIVALKRRECTRRGHHHTFQYAFQLAVESRLRPFVEEKLRPYDDRHYYCETTFVVANEARYHIIRLTQNGEFKWNESMSLYVCE